MDNDGPAIDWDNMTFSYQKTDRMFIAHCEQGGDWQSGVMQDFQDLSISPAAGVLNYGQGLFEGMKAQRAADGSIVLFRPERNAKRMQDGASRLGIPVVPEEMFLDAVRRTVLELSLIHI